MGNQAEWLSAYIDESGDPNLETHKSGASNLFICTAVVVDEYQDLQAKEGMQNISREFFSGSEIKSSNIGGNHPRRVKILKEIKNLSFGYYALIIDKKQIGRDSGLQYKRTFYKFLNRMLYNRLLRGGTNLHIIADEIGGAPFMDSFLPYLKNNGIPDLFTFYDHKFVSSAATPQIQLADLIAGTLAWCFDEEKATSYSDVFRELIRPKEISISSWPLRRDIRFELPDDEYQCEWDEKIHQFSINRAFSFIQEFENAKEDERHMQVAALRHLLFLREYESGYNAGKIISNKLISYLMGLGFPKLSRQQLSSLVIGPLRDSGIIISGSSDGYRLACTVVDIHRYLSHDLSIIYPMISRLKTARQGIRQDTSNQFDILDETNYSFLKDLVEIFSEKDVERDLTFGREELDEQSSD